MNFGFVDDLSIVDFTLPPDHPKTKNLLKKKKKKTKPEIYVGCAKWGRQDWVNILYPKGTKSAAFLDEYVNHFNSVELNATFHRMPTPEMIRGWAEKSNSGFKFCPKFPQIISHRKEFNDKKILIDLFSDAVSVFGKKLGHCFFQLPPHFSIKKKEKLIDFLPQLQSFPVPVHIEFRHANWFTQTSETEEFFDLLEKMQLGVVITDTAGRRDVLHQRLTIPHAFIRYVGNRLHPTDFSRIDEWAERLDVWLKQGLQTLYFFLHNDEAGEAYSPELAAYTVKKFNERLKLNLPESKLVGSIRNKMKKG